jgi:hypothetical protein
MSEPTPTYEAVLQSDGRYGTMTSEQWAELEKLERQLTAALKGVWRQQGKRKKIIDLAP